MVLKNYRGSQFLQSTALGHYEADFEFRQEDGLMLAIGVADLYSGGVQTFDKYGYFNYTIEMQDSSG